MGGWWWIAGLLACFKTSPSPPDGASPEASLARAGAASAPPPNILLIIADDVGIDLVGTYRAKGEPPPTPTLDRLADQGVLFERAYAFPWCSPTRAGILTGRLPRHYDLGRAIKAQNEGDVSLPLSATTLPELLDRSPRGKWSHALVGKWHLSTLAEGASDAPIRHGFDRFLGASGNLYGKHAYDGAKQSYFDWERSVDGALSRTRSYATTQNVDDTLAVIEQLEPPWFVWLAFQAAHDPWNPPPDALHSYGDLSRRSNALRYRAVVEAMDREMGRLLDTLDPATRERTLVLFVGDNGTASAGLRGAFEGVPAKRSVFEAGVRVPLIASGSGVVEPGRRVHGLVHTNDLFATILDLAGVDTGTQDDLYSQSFAAALRAPSTWTPRPTVFSEAFEPNGPGPYRKRAAMVRDERFKLIRDGDGDRLYDLNDRVLETAPVDLATASAEAEAAFTKLSAYLDDPR